MNDQRARQAVSKFSTALANLEEEIRTYGGDKKSRNSVLLCFVLAFETVWKALKFILFTQEGVEAPSPKETLRQAYALGWLGSDDTVWLAMADDRNLVAHTYSEQQAAVIYTHVLNYSQALRALHTHLQQRYSHLFESAG
jgi:nucleotidyltransferase substrate binding protein (TIGR01987 family)